MKRTLGILLFYLPALAFNGFEIRLTNQTDDCQNVAIFQQPPEASGEVRADIKLTVCAKESMTIRPPQNFVVRGMVEVGKAVVPTGIVEITDPNANVRIVDNPQDLNVDLNVEPGKRASQSTLQLTNATDFHVKVLLARDGSAVLNQIELAPRSEKTLRPDESWWLALVPKKLKASQKIDFELRDHAITMAKGGTVKILTGPSGTPILNVEK